MALLALQKSIQSPRSAADRGKNPHHEKANLGEERVKITNAYSGLISATLFKRTLYTFGPLPGPDPLGTVRAAGADRCSALPRVTSN